MYFALKLRARDIKRSTTITFYSTFCKINITVKLQRHINSTEFEFGKSWTKDLVSTLNKINISTDKEK